MNKQRTEQNETKYNNKIQQQNESIHQFQEKTTTTKRMERITNIHTYIIKKHITRYNNGRLPPFSMQTIFCGCKQLN